jgi:hypothetical protein
VTNVLCIEIEMLQHKLLKISYQYQFYLHMYLYLLMDDTIAYFIHHKFMFNEIFDTKVDMVDMAYKVDMDTVAPN